MKILVAIKRVVDYRVNIRVKADGSGVETQNVKMALNPFDEIAIEEALRLKEGGSATEVVVVTIGSTDCQENLRHALALGADRAVLVEHDELLEPLSIAKLLAAVVQSEQPALVLTGKQAIDDDCNQTGQMLAALLDWPQATFASNVVLAGNSVEVVREVDGGLEVLALTLPAVVTSDLRLNQPRFVTLPNIMKARAKLLTTLTAVELAVTLVPHQQVLRVEPPAARKKGIRVADVAELVSRLKQEAKVL